MQIRAKLVDADGHTTTRVEQRRWLLNYISGHLEQGNEIVIVTEMGCISAVPELPSGVIKFRPHTWNGIEPYD